MSSTPATGAHVGFYGGVNYGFGYDGDGFHGGLWEGEHFAYNATVMNVNCAMVRNTYVENVHFNNVGISQSLRPGSFGQLMALRWIFGQLMVFSTPIRC
ncbi:MAG TPA: hypothetical protein VNW54_14910 [Granulicella sp.]|nr:hypothetical protein [Granulicella sp.]